jgi:hypothetical protein
MGIIRFLLAISVLVAHTNSFDNLLFFGAQNSVQLFYIISGFLISYILNEKKNYENSIIKFYFNRILRIYPIYIFVLILTVIYIFFLNSFSSLDNFKNFNLQTKALVIFSNIIILTQDWLHFISVVDFSIKLNLNIKNPLSQWLIVGPAWTLGLEMTFYIIAPFIIKKKLRILIFIFISAFFRLFLIKEGLYKSQPWSYMFFPSELHLFLLGTLSHLVLSGLYIKIFKKNYLFISKIFTYFFLIFIIFYPYIKIESGVIKIAILFFLFLLILPMLFCFQNNNFYDKSIGVLSYPIYICHEFIINILKFFFNLNQTTFIFLAIFCSIIFSIFLNIFVQKKFEGIRTYNKIKS